MATTELPEEVKTPISNSAIDRVMTLQDDRTFERDPSGIDAHQAGAKLDAGKPMVGLVLGGFANALMEVSKVGTFGAKKYTANGWKQVKDGQDRYTDAMMRHWLYEMAGEDVDPDSDLYHAAHLAWNALARLEFIIGSDPTYGRSD